MNLEQRILRALLADRLQHSTTLDADAQASFQGLLNELDQAPEPVETAVSSGPGDTPPIIEPAPEPAEVQSNG